MDVPGRREDLPALLNHRSPGVSPGTWESRGMSPTGYPGYPTPLRCIEPGPAMAVNRRIRPCGIKLSRGGSEEFPESREVFQAPLQSDFPHRVRLEWPHLPLNQGPEGLRIRQDRDVRGIDSAVDQPRDMLVLQREMVLRPVFQLNQDRLVQLSDLRPERRIGRDLPVEFPDQVLEHLPHLLPPL